jgi:hypothetical protein
MSHYLQHPKLLLALTTVAAFSFAYPASVQAVPTTYRYTGNPFTSVSGVYTTSDFVTAMITLSVPLGANLVNANVTPTAFTLSDGMQTITNLTAFDTFIQFSTDASGTITFWNVLASSGFLNSIGTSNDPPLVMDAALNGSPTDFGNNLQSPGGWRVVGAVADTGSTLSLMALTLMALGVAARRFQRAAA